MSSEKNNQDENEDLENDNQSDEPEEESQDQEAAEITETIEEVKEQLDAARDRNLRLMAEFDNYKRRTAKDFERLVENANEKLILEIVDVRENFERALKAVEAGGEFAPFYDGMRLIFTQFNEVLSRNGLSVFAEIGEEFDPAIHDALMKSPNDKIPENHIAEVFERGYRLKDKVVKHARVIVSGGASA
ncbi:MAG: nucleotide exchange factor GrpE [Chitinispirillales bacterium]|jgi:molecular chaperone GrpE|nr:nucleotide exchange factor GrpE [Chitinispirillales bacterium]